MTTFTASAFAPLYWNEAGIGYLLPLGATAADSLTLDETWTAYAGCYLVVGAPVPADAASQQRFAGAVRTLLADPARGGTRFAWIAHPNDPSGRLTGPTVALSGTATRAVAPLGLGGLDLVLAPGCAFSQSDDGTGFAIAGSAYLSAPDGTDLQVVHGDLTLPLTGATPGAVQTALQLGDTAGVDDLTHLDVGLRVFFPAAWPDGQPSDSPFLDSHRHPIFADTALALAASLDPSRPLDPARSFLAFPDTEPIASRYLTNLGHRLSLAPAAGAKLVFAPRPPDTGDPADSPVYLVPSGDFTLSLTGANLMCGISGVEYLKLPRAGASTLTFVPGGAAYAGGDEQQPLTSAATTAWAYVRCDAAHGHLPGPSAGDGTPVPYCAQPDSSVLHAPPATGDPAQPTPLSYLEVVSATLPHPSGPPSAPFPLLPYDGVDAEVAAAAQALETAAVAPARRAAIAKAGAQHLAAAQVGAPQDGPDVVATTPQGLLATFSSDKKTMKRLQLALNQDGTEVALQNIPAGSSLWTALQSNQLMLVVTDPQSILPYVDTNAAQLRADDWTFDLDPTSSGDWRRLSGEHPTFLVFKFAAKPLAELAAQPGSWAQADAFNASDPATASLALSAFVQDAVDQAKTDANFAAFVGTVLNDPAWNGIVALNCNTPIGGWPQQLQGLAAGIDPQRLVAHHAGVQATPVQTKVDPTTKATSLQAQPSSIFGLIDYRDPALLSASSAPYDFKVLLLEVLVTNSHVAAFASQVTLQANQLFAEKATLAGGKDNNLLFNGTYQSANGHGSYSFLLAAKSTLTITSAVLAEVDLARAEFVTTAQPSGASIQTRFLMWGTLRFEALHGFDAFAFDSLAFANLAVDMAVTPSGDSLPPSKVMSFDANHLSFDLDQSNPRPDSLYAAFPLLLTTFVQAGASTKPTDLDYAPVATPLTPGDLGAPWFGLGMQLELGGQGALAPGGSFTANLLVAWGVSDGDEPNAFVGLQLPGTSGGQLQITLEGPLKLSLKSVSFSVDDGGAYLLWMQSLALGLFGLTFPPTGRTDILLFAKGNGKRTLGWYAVYDKGSSVQQAGGDQQPDGGQKQVAAG